MSELLDPRNADRAVCILRAYFEPGAYTGGQFESFAGGGDRAETVNTFTADDLVAVSLLSVAVPGRAALEILDRRSAALNDALAAVRPDVEFAALTPADLGPEWPVRSLYFQLREIHGIGETVATKLLARKRPHLVPILDSVVTAELSIVNGQLWLPLHAWLTADDRANDALLRALRTTAGLDGRVSVLRVFDVLTWMTGTGDAERVCPGTTRSAGAP